MFADLCCSISTKAATVPQECATAKPDLKDCRPPIANNIKFQINFDGTFNIIDGKPESHDGCLLYHTHSRFSF